MKGKILICLLFYTNLILSQEYFNIIIPTDFGNVNASSIYRFDDQAYISGIYFTEEENIASILINVDDLFEYNYYHYNGFAFSKRPINKSKEGFSVFGKDRNKSKGLILAHLDNNLSLIDVNGLETQGDYNFPSESVTIFYRNYNGFIITQNDAKKIGINKSSISGEILWTKYYENNIGYSYLWSLLPTIDFNLLASYTLRYDHEFRSNAYLMKIDTSGEVIWRTQPMELIDGGAAPIRMAELSNNQIVLTFRKDMWDVYEFWCCLHPKPPTFIWLDTEGQILQENIYAIQQYDELDFSDIEAGKGDYFFGYGQYTVDTGVGVDNYFGFITKFSNTGDTIWSRRYRHPEYNDERIFHIVKDIIELDNGDIVAMGAITPAGEKTEIWYFKVDSEGCFTQENCEDIQISTAVDNLVEEESFRLYPNPTNGRIVLDGINTELIKRVVISDLSGNKVLDKINHYSINLESLPSGIYLVSVITANHSTFNQKIVLIK